MRGSAVFRTGVAPGGALAGPWVQNSLWTRARAVPSLDLRFADNKSLVDATTGANLVDFTRASSGTYVGSDGVIRNAVTNLLLQSEDFSTSWTTVTATVTTNVATAPNGTTTADLYSGTSTSAVNQSVSLTSGVTYTISFYVKSAGLGNDSFRLRIDGAQTSSNFTATSEWQRFTFTATSANTGARTCGIVRNTAGDNVDVLIWGAQLEQSSTVGEYIPTTSTINSAPRFDHDPQTGESLGLLVEEARTNLLVRSEEFDDASWTKSSASITTNTTTAPDGTITADTYSGTGSSGVRQTVTLTSGTVYTISFYVKSAGLGNDGFRLVINSAQSSSNFTATSEWQRFTFTATSANTGARTCGIHRNSSGGNVDVLIWGAQLEEGSFPTSYIPTVAATVTRAADVASITGSNFGVTRTNLLARSEEFDNAAWGKFQSTITANTVIAPDGTLTADKLVENTATTTHIISKDSAVTAGATYTFSVFFKAAERTFAQLRCGATSQFSAIINLSTGEVTSVVGPTTSSVISVGNGWWRFSISFAADTTPLSVRIGVVINSTPPYHYTGDGTSGIYLWGAQLEVGSAVTPYIQSPSVFTSRASSGTYVGGNGLIQTAVTNLLLQSEDFSTTWANTDSTEASNVETAPNGTLTADKLIPDVGVTSGQFRQDVSKAATATTYTCSVYGKAAEFNRFSIRVEHNGSTGNRADVGFSLSDGSVVSAAAALGTFSGASATVTSVGAGWYRFTLSFTSSTETSIRVRLFGFDSSLPCNGTSGIYLWGAQLEQASTVGEYIPTTSTINSAARYDHDPISLIGKGLLLEEARTNLVLRSEEFDNASWLKTNSTVTADGAISPDGTMDAYKIVSNSALLGFIVQSVSQTTATSYTWSVFAKAGEYSFCQLRITGTVVPSITRAYFNLATGTTTRTTNCTASITAFGNGWYKCSITYTTISAATASPRFYGQVDDADTVSDGTSGIYIWGAQMEAGAFATSYIPTTTATVTRAADISTSVATSVFESSWYNQTEGTNLIEFRETDRTGTRTPRSLSDGTASNRIDAFLSSSLTVNNRLVLAGVSYNPGNLTLSAAGTVNKHVTSAAPGSAIAVTNGTLSTESAPPSLPVVNRIVIGADSIGGTPFTGTIRRLTYWPTRLGNEVLQRITQ
jgi:hypothetical protein